MAKMPEVHGTPELPDSYVQHSQGVSYWSLTLRGSRSPSVLGSSYLLHPYNGPVSYRAPFVQLRDEKMPQNPRNSRSYMKKSHLITGRSRLLRTREVALVETPEKNLPNDWILPGCEGFWQ